MRDRFPNLRLARFEKIMRKHTWKSPAFYLVAALAVAAPLSGCNKAGGPEFPPVTEQSAAAEIKKVQDDPTLPAAAKAQRIARIKQALKTAQVRNSYK